MKKMNLMLTALFAGLCVQAQGAVFSPSSVRHTDPAPIPLPGPKPKPSWSRVQVKLGKSVRKPVSGGKVAWDLPKPPPKPHIPPTCGVRG